MNVGKLLAALRWLGGRVAPVAKALGALAGGATGVGVAAVLDVLGVHVTPEAATAIAAVLAAIGAHQAPANKPRS
ncbi:MULTISPECIES: hypothetical protein [Actinomycetes]|uniref:Uncharacterized protein n=2 Tax=Actinomycetes TaxID=1760 RepID=A0A5N8X7P1_9ACTN|nr:MULTISPECIES: hypothetical protein [Actinomycetes]MPY55469.1 hypothetical protein [Streptomyces acidicola]GHF30869.1 hypothetical protein GCM10017786_75970 [Amycolatopsis deserti]